MMMVSMGLTALWAIIKYIVFGIGCTIGFVPPPGLGEPSVFIGVPSYTVPENSGPAVVYVGIISGSIEFPRQVQISFFTSDVTAQGKFVYMATIYFEQQQKIRLSHFIYTQVVLVLFLLTMMMLQR